MLVGRELEQNLLLETLKSDKSEFVISLYLKHSQI